ncbi:hypothetical protein EYF80_043838 [Liparis tanakae]|uniref:Uncharacterized protein n=1 Tax=Liparis tanakae TaxID=230148 RepID=A0A4Z2FXI5_9TELE|nr:hypothetical protein EYF80_043838 [Liparis tanakae]
MNLTLTKRDAKKSSREAEWNLCYISTTLSTTTGYALLIEQHKRLPLNPTAGSELAFSAAPQVAASTTALAAGRRAGGLGAGTRALVHTPQPRRSQSPPTGAAQRRPSPVITSSVGQL